jgi:hypothetical protein
MMYWNVCEASWWCVSHPRMPQKSGAGDARDWVLMCKEALDRIKPNMPFGERRQTHGRSLTPKDSAADHLFKRVPGLRLAVHSVLSIVPPSTLVLANGPRVLGFQLLTGDRNPTPQTSWLPQVCGQFAWLVLTLRFTVQARTHSTHLLINSRH